MKDHKRTIIIAVIVLIVGFIFGMEYKAYQLRSALMEGFSDIGDAFDLEDDGLDDQSFADEEDEDLVFIERAVGDEIELATIKVRVNSVEETKTISSSFGSPETAKNGAKFVVVNLDMTNTTNSPFTHFDRGFILVDDQGREFPPYDAIFSIDNYLDARDLSPDITENGVMVFEMPEDSTSYTFPFAKAGGNEVYNVRLN